MGSRSQTWFGTHQGFGASHGQMRRMTRPFALLGLALVLTTGTVIVLGRPASETPAATLDAAVTPEVWDGLEWSNVDVAATAGSSWLEVVGATRVQDKALVWGIAQHNPNAADRTAIWETVDGVSWTAREMLIDGTPGYAPDAIVLGSGGFLAIGYSRPADRFIAAGSVDGANWTTLPAPAPETEMWLATPTADGYVVAGASRGRPTTWRTGDGTGWTEIPLPGPLPTGQLQALNAVGDHVVLAGMDHGNDQLKPLLFRLQRDEWVPMSLPAHDAPLGWAAGIEQLVSFDGGLIAVGRSGPARDCREASAGVHFDVGMPCQWPPPAAWVSKDGKAWRDASLPVVPNVPPEDAFTSVVAGGPALVGIAHEPLLDGVSYSVWVSEDGAAWKQVSKGMRLGPGEYMNKFIALPGRLLAIGASDGGAAVAWTGVVEQ